MSYDELMKAYENLQIKYENLQIENNVLKKYLSWSDNLPKEVMDNQSSDAVDDKEYTELTVVSENE